MHQDICRYQNTETSSASFFTLLFMFFKMVGGLGKRDRINPNFIFWLLSLAPEGFFLPGIIV